MGSATAASNAGNQDHHQDDDLEFVEEPVINHRVINVRCVIHVYKIKFIHVCSAPVAGIESEKLL